MAPGTKSQAEKLCWAPTKAERIKWLQNNKIQYIVQLSAKDLKFLYDKAKGPRTNNKTIMLRNMNKFYSELLRNHLRYEPGRKNKGQFRHTLVTQAVGLYREQRNAEHDQDIEEIDGSGSPDFESDGRSDVDSVDLGGLPVPALSL